MATCDYAALLLEAKCFQGLDEAGRQLAQIGALLLWTEAVTPSLDLTPDGIMERAKCLQGLDQTQKDALEFQILCNLASGESSADADVEAFLLCSGITDDAQVTAITNLVASLKTNSLWDSFDAIYPFVGGSSSSHSCNLRDTSKFSIAWAGTVTHNSNGVTGNGSSGYGDTGFNPSTAASPMFSLNSASMGVYNKTASFSTGLANDGIISAGSGGDGLASLYAARFFSPPRLGLDGLFSSGQSTIVTADFSGSIIVSRTDSGNEAVYIGASSTAIVRTSVSLPNANVFLLAMNASGAAGSFGAENLAFAFIGSGFSDSQITTLKAIILTYQTALGRN